MVHLLFSVMNRNTSVILGNHFDQFIQSEIQSGRYKSASELIREALRILETERTKINAINEALVVGEASGDARQFDNEAFKLRMKAKLKENA